MLDNVPNTTHAVWYGFSTDANGTSWVMCQPAVLPASVGWDYPSVAADATGRVIVGAVSASAQYYTIMSDGSCAGFQNATRQLVPAGSANLSRLVATDYRFELFVPTLSGTSFVPTAINRFESSDGVIWSNPILVTNIPWPAQNNSLGKYSNSCPYPNQPCNCANNQQQPPCGPIFYAPNPDAKGFTNGLWIVGFAVNNGGFNNIEVCSSDRGCGLVNKGPDDQFLQGVSVAGNGQYWVSYYTYHATAPNPASLTLPLITQAIFFPPGGTAIGATTNNNIVIDPKSWTSANNQSEARCSVQLFLNCFAAGDFQHIASNIYSAASTPFIAQTPPPSQIPMLFQSFVQDPQRVPNIPNFKPNYVPISEAELQLIGRPLPPETWGVPPVGR